jgi:hypothetical protein
MYAKEITKSLFYFIGLYLLELNDLYGISKISVRNH